MMIYDEMAYHEIFKTLWLAASKNSIIHSAYSIHKRVQNAVETDDGGSILSYSAACA